MRPDTGTQVPLPDFSVCPARDSVCDVVSLCVLHGGVASLRFRWTELPFQRGLWGATEWSGRIGNT